MATFTENLTGDTQLRKYPRLAADFPVTYVVEDDPTVRRGQAQDIGGGGLCFESSDVLETHTTLTLWFEFRAGCRLEVFGKVVASNRSPASGLYRHRLAFSRILDADRDAILSHIFTTWRSLLLSQA